MLLTVAALCGALTGAALAQSSPTPSAMSHGAMHAAMKATPAPKMTHAAMKGSAMKGHAMKGTPAPAATK
jgi:hypothetical protein